jgi:hypothetical protein
VHRIRFLHNYFSCRGRGGGSVKTVGLSEKVLGDKLACTLLKLGMGRGTRVSLSTITNIVELKLGNLSRGVFRHQKPTTKKFRIFGAQTKFGQQF